MTCTSESAAAMGQDETSVAHDREGRAGMEEEGRNTGGGGDLFAHISQ